MKKLLVSALAVLAAVVAFDLSATSCCRKETSCKTACDTAPKGKVCEREVIRHPRPEVRCRKWVPVDSCCNLKEITEVRYEPSCPAGFEQDGEAFIAEDGSRTTQAVNSKEATTINKTNKGSANKSRYGKAKSAAAV